MRAANALPRLVAKMSSTERKRGYLKEASSVGLLRRVILPVASLFALSSYLTSIHLSRDLWPGDSLTDLWDPATVSALVNGFGSSTEIVGEEDYEYEVSFLDSSQLSNKDGFSASWLQRRDTFLMMDLDTVAICEDAVFRTYTQNRRPLMRMTVDWLDFSIEHLSKWWKMLDVFNSKVTFKQFNNKLNSYLNEGKNYEIPSTSKFSETIAAIAYRPYSSGRDERPGKQLTTLSLAATIESLRRVGMGRVLVVGSEEYERALVEETFSFLRKKYELSQTNKGQIGDTEVAFVIAPRSGLKTKFLEKNMPRGALMGLHTAFVNASKILEGNHHFSQSWLGSDPYFWKYVYLTEPDSLLQAHQDAIPQIFNEVDRGNVLLPHRLQPIPHESDVPDYDGEPWKYLNASGDFQKVLDIEPEESSCCDEKQGPNFKPGAPPTVKNCGTFWYTCGFRRSEASNADAHFRLKPYDLMRLQTGSNIASIAGSEHGRRCIPKPRGSC